MSGQLNDFALIKLVESHPVLYHHCQARGHKNAEKKDKVWKLLSEQLNASERACITRWKSIRDRFGKEYRRVQEQPDEPTGWELLPHLMFLIDHYKHGNTSNAELPPIKYEPRKRKRKYLDSQGEDDSNLDSNDVDPNEYFLTQQLIALVRAHPVLYDKKQIRDSKNLAAKNDAWIKISIALNISEENCYQRWKKLRDRFSREYRLFQLDVERVVDWPYLMELSFLEEHYRKGIPLPNDKMKLLLSRRTSSSSFPQPHSEYHWNNDTSCSSTDDRNSDTITETSHDVCGEPKESLSSTEEECRKPKDVSYSTVSTTTENETEAFDPAQQLGGIISDLQNALQKSQDCLASVQQKTGQCYLKSESTPSCFKSRIVNKMNVLLDDLNRSQRKRAESTIITFLAECQIKSASNLLINDVKSVNIH